MTSSSIIILWVLWTTHLVTDIEIFSFYICYISNISVLCLFKYNNTHCNKAESAHLFQNLKFSLNFKQTTTKTALTITQEHTENLNLHKWDCPHKSKRQVCFDENSYFCGWQMSHMTCSDF